MSRLLLIAFGAAPLSLALFLLAQWLRTTYRRYRVHQELEQRIRRDWQHYMREHR